MQINAPAEAGTDSYGMASGTGGGRGSPASTGTCLAPPCGVGGGGMSVAVYTDYLTSTLQERVRRDDKLRRLIFSADLAVSVTGDGQVTGVRLVDRRGGGGEQAARQLIALLETVRGLTPPPAAMSFPQKITVQGRRAF
ncbi:hypothetical protein S2M10_33880 [Sphingomonas sp. S2M10]|nr:hypothetical protein [Sphingomonas sp. S2M10]